MAGYCRAKVLFFLLACLLTETKSMKERRKVGSPMQLIDLICTPS